jgi:Xaa-Pro aminopeptidase
MERIARVENSLQAEGLDALIAYSVRNAPGPVTFLAGYESTLGLHDISFFVLVPGSRPRYALVTNAFWDDHAHRTWVDEIVITSDFGAQLAQLLPRSVRRVGIAGFQFFPAPIFARVQAELPQTEFVVATKLLINAARCKSPAEIEAIRAAVKMTDAGGRAFLNSVSEGATEREVKTEVERAIMLAGSDTIWYGFQLSSGPDAHRGMGQMTGRTIKKGDQVQVDCGAVYRGYHGDFSRVTTVGTISKEVINIMETTAEMYEAMLECLEPGAPIAAVANASIEVARRRGLEDYIFRSPNQATRLMGHGIGCWYLEIPEVTPDTAGVIEPNMVVVLEPILTKPGIGGAKVEDAVLVTGAGAERLSEIPLRTWET